MILRINSDQAQAVCDVVNILVPNYHKDISNLEEALNRGEGNCFTRMKLGGAALQALGFGDDCYQGLCQDPDEDYLKHGFLIVNPLSRIQGNFLSIDSDYDGTYVERSYSIDEDMRLRILNGAFPIEIAGWNVIRLTRVSDIKYPKLAMEAVSKALTEMGIHITEVASK